MGKIKLDKLDIDLNMILYDQKEDKGRCLLCGEKFSSQAEAIAHLSKKHSKSNKKGGVADEMS